MNINSINNKTAYFGFATLAFISLFFFPFLFVCTLVAFFHKEKMVTYLTVFLMVSIYGYINFNKEFISDYIWYFAHYTFWISGDFDYPFNYSFYNVYARYSEPVYHLLSFTLSRLTGGSKLMYNLFFTALIYTPAAIAIFVYSKSEKLNSVHTSCFIIALFLLCINPVMVTQLIRQNIAASFLLLSLILFFFNYKSYSVLLLSLALLTHTSSLIPAFIVFGSYFIFKYDFFKYQKLLWLFGILLVGYLLPFYLSSTSTYDVIGRSDGSLNIIVYLYDIALLLAAFYVVIKERKTELNQLYFITVCFYLFILSTFSSELLLLRLYHLYDYFKIINFMIIIPYFLKRFNTNFVYISCVILGLIFIEMRYAKSPFYFGGDFIYFISKCYVCDAI